MDACKTFYCAAGFREDVNEVISRFKSLESHKYCDFAQVWKSMKFHRIFTGRSTRSELMEFCEEALDMSKEYLITNERDPVEKIGGLFMMYSIYFSMPLKGPKIRIIMSEWEILITFKKMLVENERWDCIMVLNKLVDANAFSHCLCDNERGLENYYVLKDFMKGNSRPVESQKKKKELISIFEDVMNEANNYSNLKSKLKYKLGANAIRAPLLFDVDALKKIADNVKNLDQLVKSNTQDKHNLRRSHRTTCPPDYTNGQNDNNVGQDSDQDYHQDSDSNDDDPDYQANSPESIDNEDMNYNEDEMEQDQDQELEHEHEEEEEDEDESDINIKQNQKPTDNDFDYALNKNNYDNDDQVPSTSRNDNMSNDFDYLPHIKMEKFTYVSDSSDESINFDDYRL
ncbi:protein PFC0760c [Microplitis mediator]|uniref:protein PFC0760c n=1 Tax=Microplitis mediator TaxID=375433 RepID=UPI002556514E|nr:protein PFC0760c [Microplitis mediator]